MVVKPIRNASGTQQLEYNPTTGEVSYDTLGTFGDISIADNTITTSTSNTNLELDASGNGFVNIKTGIVLDVSEYDGSTNAIDLTKPVAILDGQQRSTALHKAQNM